MILEICKGTLAGQICHTSRLWRLCEHSGNQGFSYITGHDMFTVWIMSAFLATAKIHSVDCAHFLPVFLIVAYSLINMPYSIAGIIGWPNMPRYMRMFIEYASKICHSIRKAHLNLAIVA